MKDLFLRDDTGALLPAIDGSQPLDVTHPEWEKMARATIRHLIDLGVDYRRAGPELAIEGIFFSNQYGILGKTPGAEGLLALHRA